MFNSLVFSHLRTLFASTQRLCYYTGNKSHGETHYEVLKLQNNCSKQDIRDAFVKLSKQCHPDVKGNKQDARQTAEFVKIAEAYQVLSKPSTRRAYDRSLLSEGRAHYTTPRTDRRSSGAGYTRYHEVHRPWEIHPNFNSNAKSDSYYGIKDMRRMSNTKVLLALLVFGVFGAILSFMTVKHSVALHRQQVDETNAEASKHLASIRTNAEKLGNEEQLRRLANKAEEQKLNVSPTENNVTQPNNVSLAEEKQQSIDEEN